ncbi:MAG: DUF2007 domain-containing protein [Candidatus Brocadiia bacterium]
MDEKLIVIAEYMSPMEAHFDRTLLEDNGIKCVVGNELLFNGWGVLPFVPTSLNVFESDAKRSLKILGSKGNTLPGAEIH